MFGTSWLASRRLRDLLMTAQVQSCRQPRGDGPWRRRSAFELRWGQVTKGRVQTHPVVDLLNEFRYMLLQFLHGVIGTRIDFLLLERFQKTLALPVLPR